MNGVPEDEWTPERVGQEIVEAVLWASRSAGRVGPNGFSSGMPEVCVDDLERIAMNWPLLKETEQEKRRRLYRPHEVSRMERVLLWQGKYLKPGSVQSAALRLWVFCKTRRGLSYAEVVAALPFTRATAYRRRDRALSEIALGLTADGIARGDH